MIKAAYEPPCLGPSERLQVEEADVIKHVTIRTCDTADDEELVFV
jgi:hypothetical protein